MAPSATSTSISAFFISHGSLLVLEPLRQTNADLRSVNEILVLIHEMVLAYCSHFLMAISCAKRLWYTKHSFPIPPVVVKTKGVICIVPCSRTLRDAFSRFHEYDRSVVALGPCTIQHWGDRSSHQRMPIDGAPRTHTRAWISNLASWALLDPLLNCSPEMS